MLNKKNFILKSNCLQFTEKLLSCTIKLYFICYQSFMSNDFFLSLNDLISIELFYVNL